MKIRHSLARACFRSLVWFTSFVMSIVAVPGRAAVLGPGFQAPSIIAPANVRATAYRSDAIAVIWDDKATNEEGFYLYSSTDGVNFSPLYTATNPSTYFIKQTTGTIQLSLSGYFNPSTCYWFTVQAYNSGSTSADGTTAASVCTPANTSSPSFPVGVTAAALDDTSVLLSWTDKATSEMGFSIAQSTDGTNFNYDSATRIYSSVALINQPTGAMTYKVTGLSSNTRYWFKVAAHNTLNYAPGGLYVAATPVGGVVTVLPPPTNVSATAPDSASAQVTWTDAANTETGFYILRSTDGINFGQTITTSDSVALANKITGTLTYIIPNLAASTNYWFKVAAFNAGGTSAYAVSPSSVKTLAAAAPAAPPPVLPVVAATLSSAQAEANSAAQITVSWQGTAAHYLVTNVTDGTNSGWLPGTSYTFTGLKCNTAYIFEVVGKDAQGTLTAPRTATVTTPACPVPVPNAPTIQAALTVDSDTSITIAWSGSASQYVADNTTNNATSGWTTASSFTFKGLACGTAYSFSVKGKNDSGVVSAPAVLSASTNACLVKPAAPPEQPVTPAPLAPPNLAAPSTPTATSEIKATIVAVANSVDPVDNTVRLKVTPEAKPIQMIISDRPDFQNSNWVPFTQAPLFAYVPSTDGKVTIYIKFKDATGSESVPAATTFKTVTVDDLIKLTHYKETSARVRQLQQALKKLKFLPKNWRATLYYGTITKTAVETYQASQLTLDELLDQTKLGLRGPKVARLQRELKKLGFYPKSAAITSRYDKRTAAAVEKYLESRDGQ